MSNSVYILGVIGPWQVILLLAFLFSIVGIILLIVRVSRGSKKIQTIDQNARIVINNQNSNTNHQAGTPPQDAFDQLEKLQKLRDSGTLTEEEFQDQKTRILKK